MEALSLVILGKIMQQWTMTEPETAAENEKMQMKEI